MAQRVAALDELVKVLEERLEGLERWLGTESPGRQFSNEGTQ